MTPIVPAMLALLSGCSGAAREGHVQPGSLPESILQSGANPVVRRLTSADHGLQVRKWVVATDSERLASVMLKYQDGPAATADVLARLQRNGLRLVRVRVEELDAVLAELGGASTSIDSWFGQAVTWSEAHGRAIPEPGRAIAVDGRVQWFQPGEVRLMIRGWTLPMEDGPRMQLELLPQYQRPRAADFNRILGRETPPDAMFSSIALDLRMEAGYAYALVWEQPQVEWVEAEPGAPRPDMPEGSEPSGRDVEAAGATAVARAWGQGSPIPLHRDWGPFPQSQSVGIGGPSTGQPRRSNVGPAAEVPPGEALGPDAALPQTLGEMLLGGAGSPPTLGIIAFIPRIPAEIFPPSVASPAPASGLSEDAR